MRDFTGIVMRKSVSLHPHLHTCLFFQSLFRFCMKIALESRHLAYKIAYKIERKCHSPRREPLAHSRHRPVKQAMKEH